MIFKLIISILLDYINFTRLHQFYHGNVNILLFKYWSKLKNHTIKKNEARKTILEHFNTIEEFSP